MATAAIGAAIKDGATQVFLHPGWATSSTGHVLHGAPPSAVPAKAMAAPMLLAPTACATVLNANTATNSTENARATLDMAITLIFSCKSVQGQSRLAVAGSRHRYRRAPSLGARTSPFRLGDLKKGDAAAATNALAVIVCIITGLG